MKIKVNMKNRSHRHDINWPRSRHGHKYSKYKNCLSISVWWCLYVLSNQTTPKSIWTWIHAKVKQHWGWVEESVAFKKTCNLWSSQLSS